MSAKTHLKKKAQLLTQPGLKNLVERIKDKNLSVSFLNLSTIPTSMLENLLVKNKLITMFKYDRDETIYAQIYGKTYNCLMINDEQAESNDNGLDFIAEELQRGNTSGMFTTDCTDYQKAGRDGKRTIYG